MLLYSDEGWLIIEEVWHKLKIFPGYKLLLVSLISVLNTQRIFNLALLDGLLVIKFKHPHLKLFYLILRGKPGSKELSNS